MHQAASGDGNIQILIKDSPNCVVTIGGRKVVNLWLPSFRIPLDPIRHKEIDLLLARHAITTLTGRDELWQSCLAWCDTAAPVSIRCITGRGGSGKTRFALEFAHHLRDQPNWDARFVKWTLPEPIDLWSETHGSNNVLLIVDYAADHATPLAASLQQLANNLPQSPNRRLRILLLARTADWDQGWLTALKPGSTNDEPIDSFFDPPKPIELPALDQANRIAVFAQALKKAAEFTGLATPALPAPESFESHRAKETLRDPLTLMMAAVVGLHSGIPEALSLTRLGLAHEVADRLVAQRLSNAFGDQAQLARHMAAYLTLCGGLTLETAQDATVTEARENNLGTLAAPGAFIEHLRSWLPSADGGLAPLEPDIVGEAFVLGKTKPHLSHATATVLRAAEQAPKPVVSFLARSAQDFGFPEDRTDTRNEPLLWFEALVDKAEDQSPSLLWAIQGSLPHTSVVLTSVALRVAQIIHRLLEQLSKSPLNDDSIGAAKVEALNALAGRQFQSGMLQESHLSMKGALEAARELARRAPEQFSQLLADSLMNFANSQTSFGLLREAVVTASDGVLLRRTIAINGRRRSIEELAISLTNYAAILSSAGDDNGALVQNREALQLFRRLSLNSRDEVLLHLANCLSSLANRYTKIGQHRKALAVSLEARPLWQELTQINRDNCLRYYSDFLSNLTAIQTNLGRLPDALSTAGEALPLLRELVERDRLPHLPYLARLLNNFAGAYYHSGKFQEAIVLCQESVTLREELTRIYPEAHSVDLATSQFSLALSFVAATRSAEAGAAFEGGLRNIIVTAERNPIQLAALVRALLDGYRTCAGAGVDPVLAGRAERISAQTPR